MAISRDTIGLRSLPDGRFNGPGNRTAILRWLDAIERLIVAGQIDQALRELQKLRQHVDGCGSAADSNDRITDCAAQQQVRVSIDALITNLSKGG